MANSAETIEKDQAATPAGVEAQDVELTEVDSGAASTGASSIDMLLDMEVPITVCLGKARVTLERLLQLGPGGVIQLDKSIQTPVDLYLKENRFATGRVVVVDGKFAIRIEQVVGKEASEESDKA